MRVAFVGVGSLGGHLAASLLRAGHDVVVHDRDQGAVDALIAAGGGSAATPAAAARGADCAVTCLPSPAAVTAVVAGPEGILAGLAPGTCWIDSSTNDLHELQRLAALAAARGIDTLEAPVTGGVHRAAAGLITVIIGGDTAVAARYAPVFDAVGGEVFHVGPLGSASTIKVITNMLAFIHLVATGEALMLAKRGGLDLAQAFDVIRASSGTSFVHETEGQLILNGSYDVGFSNDLALKDLGFATALGRELGVPLELAALVEQTFVRARSVYGGGAQSTQVVKLLEDALGTDLRAPGFPARLEPG